MAASNYSTIRYGVDVGAYNYGDLPPDPLKRALSHPDDLGAQLNALWRASDYQQGPFEYQPNWSQEDAPPVQPRLEDWLTRIESQFHQSWLPAFGTSVRLDQMEGGGSFLTFPLEGKRSEQLAWLDRHRGPNLQALALKKRIEAGAQSDPGNAFWILIRARWEWSYAPRAFYAPPRSNFAFVRPNLLYPPLVGSMAPGYPGPALLPSPPGAKGGLLAFFSDPPAPLGPYPLPPLLPNEEGVVKRIFAILSRARHCTYFDDGNWQANREVVRDLQSAKPYNLEAQLASLSGATYTRWRGDQIYLPGYLRDMLWGRVERQGSPTSVQIPFAPYGPTRPLIQRTSLKQLLAWGSVLTHIARLEDRLPKIAYFRRYRAAYRWLNVRCAAYQKQKGKLHFPSRWNMVIVRFPC